MVRECLLRDIANVQMGQSPDGQSYNKEAIGVPLINGPTEFTFRYPQKIQWTSQPTKMCRKGDVLFYVRGSSTGRMNIADDEYCIGRGVAAISAIEGKSTIEYLEQSLQYIVDKLVRLTTGSTFPNIDKKTIESFPLAFHPLPEQRKIAEILSCWDRAIEKTEELIEKETSAKAGLVTRLLSFPMNTEYAKMPLRKFLVPTTYPVGKPLKSYYALSIRSHGKGTFERFVEDPEKVAMDTLYAVKPNELIVNITFAWEGAIAITSEDDSGKLVSHRFPTYKFKENVVSVEFFRHVIKTKRFKFFLGLISPGGAGRNRVLNKKDFLKLEWPIPPMSKQNEIANILNTCDKRIATLERYRTFLQKQKNGLMAKLFSEKSQS